MSIVYCECCLIVRLATSRRRFCLPYMMVDSKLTERLAFGESRGYDPGQHLTLLHGAHPLVPVSSWGIGMAVF